MTKQQSESVPSQAIVTSVQMTELLRRRGSFSKSKRHLCMGKDLWLMVSLVIISTIDLDDWMPGSRAPDLFVFAPPEQQRKGAGTRSGDTF